MRYLLLLLFLNGLLSLTLNAAEWALDPSWQILFDDGKAIPAEKTATRELAEYLKKITGDDFIVTRDQSGGNGKKLVVGYHDKALRFFSKTELSKLGPEEFLIRTGPDGTVYIVGGRPRGTLFGVYHFLDNILGVHWYSPEFEYVPKREKITLPELDVHEKPAFEYRKRSNPFGRYRERFGVCDPVWTARNRLNDNGSIPGNKYARIEDEYGRGVYYAPPYPCHALHLLVPPKTYFKEHPEWWALQNGTRQVYGPKSGVSASYCLTNPELLATTIAQVRKNLRAYPESSYVSVAEGDFTKGPCECDECRKMMAKYGGKESGLWINFANQVADAVKEEFPRVKVGTLAYTASAEPPENIAARDNVIVWLCVWAKPRGLPYADPRNEEGRKFIDGILRKWTAICPNVHIWDYVTTFENAFLPMPDIRFNIDNLKTYHEAGVTGIYPEGGHLPEGSGVPFKLWLLARAQWNPDRLDYDALLETFCNEYYGPSSGPYIRHYWQMLENANRESGYYQMTQGGWMGKAPHASRRVMMEADQLYRQALERAENPVYRKHIRIARLPVQCTVLQNWNEWSRQGTMPAPLDQYYAEALRTAEEFDLYYDKTRKLKDLLPSFYNTAKVDFNATASKCYGGCTPYSAFDGNPDSRVAFGAFKGWLQVEFPAPREISRIVTLFGKQNKLGEYEITGSLDGKKWFPLVPKRVLERNRNDLMLFADDALEPPAKVKFIRTRISRLVHRNGKDNWTGIYEQFFNPGNLPKLKND